MSGRDDHSDSIEFVSNYADRSNQHGFQFEFTCNRCRSGYRTPFKPSITNGIAQVLQVANSFFGGMLGKAATAGNQLRNATWQRARDDAFREGIEKIRPQFILCSKCQFWVCRAACWNTQRGLCKKCAPDLAVEMSAAQASIGVQEAWKTAKIGDADKQQVEGDRGRTIQASCPKCEAPLAANVNFCPSCGTELHKEKHCTQCGGKLAANAKFCADCGTKVSS